MSAKEVLKQLRQLSNSERLLVIEAATHLIRADLAANPAGAVDEDSVLRVAGCLSGPPLSAAEIEKELYGEE